MVVALVFLTLMISILAFDIWNRLQARHPARSPARVPPLPRTDEVYWHSGHTWALPLNAETASIGIDGFALRLLGRIDQIHLPKPGTRLMQGETFASARQGSRWVHFAAPVGGTVREVNPDGLDHARSGQERYLRGWLCQVGDPELLKSISGLISSGRIHEWMSRQVQLVLDFFSDRHPEGYPHPVIPDGGTLVDGLLESSDDETWNELTYRLFGSTETNRHRQ